MKHKLYAVIFLPLLLLISATVFTSPVSATGESYSVSGKTMTVTGGDNVRRLGVSGNRLVLTQDSNDTSKYIAVLDNTPACPPGGGVINIGVSGGSIQGVDGSCNDRGT